MIRSSLLIILGFDPPCGGYGMSSALAPEQKTDRSWERSVGGAEAAVRAVDSYVPCVQGRV